MQHKILNDMEVQLSVFFDCTMCELRADHRQVGLDYIQQANASQWVVFHTNDGLLLDMGYKHTAKKIFLTPEEYKRLSHHEEQQRLGKLAYGTKFIVQNKGLLI